MLVRLIEQYIVFIQKRCLEMPLEKDHVGVLRVAKGGGIQL